MTEDASERLLTVADAPPLAIGATLDMGKLRAQIDRLLRNRAHQLDRFNQLHLFGEGREDDLKTGRWNGKIKPGDPPCTQMIIQMVREIEAEDWAALNEQDPFKARTLRNQMLKTISDLCIAERGESDKVMKEITALVEQHQSVREHEDRMRVAEKTGDQSLSDEELLARAAELRAKRAKQVPDGDE